MNSATRKTLMSSASGEWETPPEIFDPLCREFDFDLDVCATEESSKCIVWFDKEFNGLVQPWAPHICWMNPPYGKPEHPCATVCKKKKCKERGFHISEYVPGIGDFVAKAFAESRHGAVVVALLPARTDTLWWHGCVMQAEEVRFVEGRLKFLENGKVKDPAPFPSAIVVFRPHEGETRFSSWSPGK